MGITYQPDEFYEVCTLYNADSNLAIGFGYLIINSYRSSSYIVTQESICPLNDKLVHVPFKYTITWQST